MKKLTALLLALILCMGLAVPALAATPTISAGYTMIPLGEDLSTFGRHYFHNGKVTLYHMAVGWGYMDTTGTFYERADDVIYIFDYSEGYAPFIDINFKVGYMDATGKMVIPAKYDHYHNMGVVYAGRVINGQALVYDAATDTFSQINMKDQKVTKTLDPNADGVLYSDVIGNTTGVTTEKVTINGEVCEVEFSEGYGLVTLEDDTSYQGTRVYLIKKNGTTPSTPSTPAAPANTALASTQAVKVDGKAVTFDAYALRDANGGLTNYVKLRDLAHVLNSSAAQFEVTWDASVRAINIVTDKAYTAVGGEMRTPFSGDRTYTDNASPIYINGKKADLKAITLTDDNGGAYTYFKLRDLAQALGFDVSWSATAGITIDTDKPYTAD